MLEFKKIEIDDVDIYNRYIGNNAELSCENAFVNLLVWQCKYNNMMAIKDGQIFIKSGYGEKESFRLPLGGDLKAGIAIIKEYCGDKKPVFWSPECTAFEKFKADFADEYNFTEVRDYLLQHYQAAITQNFEEDLWLLFSYYLTPYGDYQP